MKTLLIIMTLSITFMTTGFAKENSRIQSGNTKYIKVVKQLKRETGKRLTPIELNFIKGFTAGDGSSCDPLVPDCSGCGFFEKYMCEAMADVVVIKELE